MSLASTLEIIAELKAGRMVILVDEEDRENEGDLVIAADFVTPEAINFMARYGRGLICLTLTQERCRLLNLPPMTHRNGTQYGTAFTVSIEAAEGVTTGISASDRARTIAAAVAHDARAEHIVQPGHVFPIQAQPGGVLVRAGHTEAVTRVVAGDYEFDQVALFHGDLRRVEDEALGDDRDDAVGFAIGVVCSASGRAAQ